MRLAAALMMFAAVAVGGEHPQRLSLIVVDPSHRPDSSTNTAWTGGVALEYSLGLSSHLSLDVRNGYERHIDYFYTLFRPTHPPGNTQSLYWERRVTTRPWALSATYRGNPLGRWTPRFSAGVRYVRAPIGLWSSRRALVPQYHTPHFDYYDRTSAQITAGADLRLSSHLAFRGDVARLLRHEGTAYDRRTTGSFGVIWRVR